MMLTFLIVVLGYWLSISNSSPYKYNSVLTQSLHYYSRPHESIHLGRLNAAAAWSNATMPPSRWMYVLNESERQEVREAVAVMIARNRSIGTLVTTDLPLPTLGPRLRGEWRQHLSDAGRGILVLRGVPVNEWSDDTIASFFWLFGRYLGTPGAQDNAGELIAHVRDTGANPRRERQYKTKARIDFHCDVADVVGLLCIRPAKEGGTSRIVSSVSIFNELIQKNDGDRHIQQLYQPVLMDTRGTGNINFFALPPLRYADGVLRTYWHQEYYRSAYRHARAGMMPPHIQAALDAYDDVASQSHLWLDMELQTGDIQLLNNHLVQHARTAYDDHDDPKQRRHLLRLWLSLDPPATLWLRFLKELDRMRMLRSLFSAKLFN